MARAGCRSLRCARPYFLISLSEMLLAAARDQRLDGLEQLRLLVRLAEVIVDADLDGARAMLLAHARRDHDDRDAREPRIRAHLRRHFVTVHARHLDVEQDD